MKTTGMSNGNSGRGARIASLILGAWLFVSAFLWPHGASQFTNTWLLGVLIVAFSLVAMAYSQARYLLTAAAIWLFISVWVLPTTMTGTQWNNALVAVLVFLFSLVPGREEVRPMRPRTV